MLTKAEITLVKSLSDKRGRAEHGMFAVEGLKMAQEAISSGFMVHRIYATREKAEEVPDAQIISDKEMERISSLKSPNGIITLVSLPRYDVPNLPEGLSLALDGIQDPGNLGTIIRIADWFGIADILCSSDSADCFNPKVVQATMGAIFRVRVHYCDLQSLLGDTAQKGTPIYGTFLDGENIYDAALTADEAAVVVMGSEGRGVSPTVAQVINRRLFIPPYPHDAHTSESLNVAAATAIVCSEFRRRNR
jgi:TrmH family RNA methyltransferase